MANYATIADGDTYFATQLFNSPWVDAPDERKTAALTQATQIINRLPFDGDKTDESQANAFPRDGDTDVPNDILVATYLIAIALLNNFNPETAIQNINTTMEGSSVHTSGRRTYDKDFISEHIRYGVPSGIAWLYLRPYLSRGNITLSRVN